MKLGYQIPVENVDADTDLENLIKYGKIAFFAMIGIYLILTISLFMEYSIVNITLLVVSSTILMLIIFHYIGVINFRSK